MAAIRKFLFDTDFTVVEHRETEVEPEDVDTPEGEESEPPVEEAPPPMFSEEDLEIARGQGFAEGKQEGVREAAAAIDQQIANTLAQIGGRLPDLFTAQDAAVEDLRHSGILLIRSLAHKVLPGMAERGGLDEIEHLASLVLERLRSEPRVVFRVNEALGEAVRARMTEIAALKGLNGTVEIVADAGVAPGDCRVEWSDGGAERRTGALLEEIDQIIARNLGGTVDDLFADPAPVTPDPAPTETDGQAGDEPDTD